MPWIIAWLIIARYMQKHLRLARLAQSDWSGEPRLNKQFNLRSDDKRHLQLSQRFGAVVLA
jgi:hypothetical protein